MKKQILTLGLLGCLCLTSQSLTQANNDPKIIIDKETKKILIQTGGTTLSLKDAQNTSGSLPSSNTGVSLLSGSLPPSAGNLTGNTPTKSTPAPEVAKSTPKSGSETGTELERAISRMYANGLTQYATLSGYRPQDPVLREEAAKIIGQAYQVLNYPQNTKNNLCDFADSKLFNPNLRDFIQKSCQWGIFKGTAGNFLPHKTLSKAEALTVLIRIFEGSSSLENINPRWTLYFIKAKTIGLTNETDVNHLDRPTSREELALLIYRFKNLILNQELSTKAKSQLLNVNQNPSSFMQSYLTGTNTTTGDAKKPQNPILELISDGKESSSSLSILNNPEIAEAMHRMKEYSITNANNITDYAPFENLTREQAAKMFVQFAKIEGFQAISGANSSCNFKDLKQATPSLVSSIQEACKLGLMQGANNLFSPKVTMNKSEFITLLIRLSEGKKLDENLTPWWKNYFIKARDLGIINNDDALALDTPITRYEVALIFYRFRIKQKILNSLNTSQLRNELITSIKGENGNYLVQNGNYQISIDANILKNQFFQEGFAELLGQRYRLRKTNLTTFDIANESFVWYGDLFSISDENKIGSISLVVSNGNIVDGVIRYLNDASTWQISQNPETTARYQIKKK